MAPRAFCLLALLAAGAAPAQQRSEYLRTPYGDANALVSPDGVHTLFGSRPELCELWIENRTTHQRRRVFRVTLQTLTLAWSPDSAAFVANDRAASDVEVAWLYDARTLVRMDLRALIVRADPEVVRYFAPGQIEGAPPPGRDAKVPTHSYVHAIRWLDAAHVETQLMGHTAGVRIGNRIEPGDCFDLRYRIGRDGAVQKLSQRISPITAAGCE